MSRLCFNAARGLWYTPDLSHGNVAMLVEDGSDWPISGDKIATRKGNSLIRIVDWESMENEE